MVNYPADWEVKKAGELVRVIRGVSYKDSDVHYARQNNDCLILRGGNILGDGNINIFADDNVYINRSLISESQFLKENDIIIVASTASMKVIGKSGIIDKDYNNIAPGAFLLLIRPLQNKNVFTSYITWYFRTNLYRENIKRLVAGGVIQNIKRDYITNMQIPLPPLSERHAIANTLAVFDNHINNLSELIAKKKAIRDGALNDLMTGRTRLKGFCSAWEEMKLSEFTAINPRTEIPEKFYYVDLESVKGIRLINARQETKHSAPSRARRYAKKGDVFFQTVRPYQRNNYIFKLDGDYVFSTGYAQLRTNNNPDFLFYLIQYNKFVNDVLDNCTGTSYPAINPAALAKINIHVPPLTEQQAIADTLTAFDNEILALESERDKIIQIRDGAMNDLLTGKVRLC